VATALGTSSTTLLNQPTLSAGYYTDSAIVNLELAASTSATCTLTVGTASDTESVVTPFGNVADGEELTVSLTASAHITSAAPTLTRTLSGGLGQAVDASETIVQVGGLN
jgi:hypothetical protein